MALLATPSPARERARWPLHRAVMAACLVVVAHVQAATNREYEVKAVFLFNFTQFVEWPPEAFATPGSPVTVGVLGDDPFGPLLDQAVAGESAGGRSLAVRRFRRVEEIDACQVLFISASESARVERILAALKGRPILTVGDTAGFARLGGMIRFYTENKKLRLRVNLAAARAAGLVLSSKLLRSAEIVPAPEAGP